MNGTLLAAIPDGPPYATDWVDANPFDPAEIAVAVADDHGNTARDAVTLKPLDVIETSEVSRVLLDTSVQDNAGRFVRALGREDFAVREDGVPQVLDIVGNPHGLDYLARDCRNVCRWFSARGLHADPDELLSELVAQAW